MSFSDTILTIDRGSGPQPVVLTNYLDAESEERAATDAYAWIKALRHALVDGRTLRERFTYRGDSLWWFAELYLHKEQAILTLFRSIRAAESLLERERPEAIDFATADRVVRTAVGGVAAAHGIRCPALPPADERRRRASLDVRSTALALAAMASPGRPHAPLTPSGVSVAAFVHTAFWRATAEDAGSAESYIGPVSRGARVSTSGWVSSICRRRTDHELSGAPVVAQTGRRDGPNCSGRAAHPAVGDARVVVSLEIPARRAARAVGSDDLRQAAVIRGYDCWPIVREALDGIALLQFPWSARAMDEAGAALDAVQPDVAVTYAEAGGWGRALALEARRRAIPVGRAAAWLHLPPLAELPTRGGRDASSRRSG